MIEHRITFLIWLTLVGLTLLGYWIGQRGFSGTSALVILLGAALIKSQLVISLFMEMREAQTRWKWVPTIWLLLVIAAIALTYQ
jgi:heme/copper-type cytochrome/quinol oxidase subunit 4